MVKDKMKENAVKKEIILNYLQIAKDGCAKLVEEYYQSLKGKSQKEAYKLVAKHHEKVKKFVKKVSDDGFAELERKGILITKPTENKMSTSIVSRI